MTRLLTSCAAPIVVTGGGGWLGQALLSILERCLSGPDFRRRVHVFGSDDRRQKLPSGETIAVRHLSRLGEATFGPAYYFHFAFLTKDRLGSVDPDAFIEANRAIAGLVEGAIGRNGLAGLFVPSSGAVYRRGTHDLEPDIGVNPYGALKLADEHRFGALAARAGAPACMPRVFNLAGPFINKVRIYALATIILDVLDGKAVEIRATHPVVRSYLHVGDLLQLAVAMLFDPRPGAEPVFDTAGECALELGPLADRIGHVLGRPARIVRPAIDPDRLPDSYVGDRTLLLRHARRYDLELRDLETQILDTASDLATRTASGLA